MSTWTNYSYPLMDPKYAGNALLTTISAVRLLLSAVWVVVTLIFTRILLRKKVFHENVQCLLLALPISYGVSIIPNTVLQASMGNISSETGRTIQQITDTGIFGTTFNLFTFVFERLIATILGPRYEYFSSRIPFVSLLMIAAQWSSAVILMIFRYEHLITIMPLLIIIFVEWAISVVMFSALPAISRRAYDKEMTNSDRRICNLRYQSIENIRTALVLNRLVLLLSTAVFFLVAYYAVMAYVMPQWITIGNQIFHVFFVLLPSVACLIVLSYHETLKKDLRGCFQLGQRRKRVVSEVTQSSIGAPAPPNQIQSISGVNLVVPIEGHIENYFASYQNQWQ